jgi:hypothetical protein
VEAKISDRQGVVSDKPEGAAKEHRALPLAILVPRCRPRGASARQGSHRPRRRRVQSSLSKAPDSTAARSPRSPSACLKRRRVACGSPVRRQRRCRDRRRVPAWIPDACYGPSSWRSYGLADPLRTQHHLENPPIRHIRIESEPGHFVNGLFEMRRTPWQEHFILRRAPLITHAHGRSEMR